MGVFFGKFRKAFAASAVAVWGFIAAASQAYAAESGPRGSIELDVSGVKTDIGTISAAVVAITLLVGAVAVAVSMLKKIRS